MSVVRAVNESDSKVILIVEKKRERGQGREGKFKIWFHEHLI